MMVPALDLVTSTNAPFLDRMICEESRLRNTCPISSGFARLFRTRYSGWSSSTPSFSSSPSRSRNGSRAQSAAMVWTPLNSQMTRS